MMSSLSTEVVTSLSADFEASARELADDEASNITAASWVSVKPTAHARLRAIEREVSTEDIQTAKVNGYVSLAIHTAENQDAKTSITEVCLWGEKVAKEFCGLKLGTPKIRGSPDQRVELELLNSRKMATEVKQFLRTVGYFSSGANLRRILFTHRRGQQNLVVVEGGCDHDDVQVITVILRDQRGNNEVEYRQAATAAQCWNWNTDTITPLIESGDFPDKVEIAIRTFKHAHQEPNGVWRVGPFLLSCWPPSMPFLQLAAICGRLGTIQRLVQHFNVDVNFRSRKKGHTALHLAAYSAQESTVAWLLQNGADPCLTSLQYGCSSKETALDAVLWVRAEWEQRPWEIRVKKIDVFRKCFSPEQPPEWSGIISLLETAMASAEQHAQHGKLSAEADDAECGSSEAAETMASDRSALQF